ncbi:MAG TPA: hypothetical protein VF509_13490 [Sphingobium sp.]
MIFGVRPSSLFTSRWMALLWCVLICLMAIGFVGVGRPDGDAGNGAASLGTDDAGEPITTQDVSALRNAVEGE